MDLTLLSANANQLHYILETDREHSYFYPSLVTIGARLFLQIAVGIGLIWNSRYNVKDNAQMCKAECEQLDSDRHISGDYSQCGHIIVWGG
ncbi:ninjurin-A-like [Megalopta genalis]|uniref:ninjurin-A-like n=1 Tax=Megalopta genalis TaxID=115081 RepID=UPI003FCF1D5C